MFNRSIVSDGLRVAGFPRPGSSSRVWRRRHYFFLLPLVLDRRLHPLSPLSASRQLLSPPHPPPPPLYIYSFICWWLIPHYRDRSTDKRNVLGNTQCAPPFSRLSRRLLGHRQQEGRREVAGWGRGQGRGGIRSRSAYSPRNLFFPPSCSPSPSALSFVPVVVVVVVSTGKVNITATLFHA